MVGNTIDLSYIEEGDGLADDITHFWESWDDARNTWKKRAKENEQYLYATSTRETTNSDIGGISGEDDGWSHSTHIPKLTQIFDNLSANYLAALFPNEDYFDFVGNSLGAEDKRESVRDYIKTKNRLNGFESQMSQLAEDWITYGNAFCFVTFEVKSHEDPDTEQVSTYYVGPTIYRISPYDIVFNPLATSFERTPKVWREVVTLGELARRVEESPDRADWSKEILEKISNNRIQVGHDAAHYGEDLDKATQLRFDGFGSISEYFQSGYVEVLHLFGDMYDKYNQKLLKNHVISIVDRKFVIRNKPIKTWSGAPHIYHVPWRRRRDNLWGMGPLDNLIGMQFYINHLENARADAFDRMIYPDRVIEGDVTEPEDSSAPMKTYYIDEVGQGQVYNLAPDTTILQADFEIQRKAQEMEDYAGAPKQAMGIRTPGEKTKFEVQQLMNAASRIFQHKINFFERNFLEHVLNAELEVSVRNLNFADTIEILDLETGARDFAEITKDDLTTNGRIIPMGARHFEKKAQDMQNLVQVLQILEAAPSVAQHFPAELMARAIEEALDYRNFDLFRKYGRLYEEAERQQIIQIIQQRLQEQGMMGPNGEQPTEQVPQSTGGNPPGV